MSEPYVGEIRLVGFSFAPANWAFCDGSLQSISQNETLFNLIGTTFGGDGVNTFGLPDLRGRMAVHQGSGYVIGQASGTETVTVTTAQIPSHSHSLVACTAAGSVNSPSAAYFASNAQVQQFEGSTSGSAGGSMIATAGGNQPHDNMMPYLTMNYIIALYGIYPTQS